MEKRFIVLIDFSPYSADLLRYAHDWSKKSGAGLVLAHQTTVISPVMADASTQAALARVTNEEARVRLEKFAGEILPGEEKLNYMAFEQPVGEMMAKLREEPFHFLVLMGVKGTGRLKQIFIGSFVIEVIDQADAIVVAMPRNVTRFVSERIYVSINSKHQLNTRALDDLLTFTAGHVRELTFFSMAESKLDLTDTEDYLARLSQDYGDRVKTDYRLFHGESVYDNIRGIISSKTTELLVVQRRSMSLLHQPFRKFIINELVYAGETPLVVLP